MSAFFCWSSNWTVFIMLCFQSSLYILDSNLAVWYLFTYGCPIHLVPFVKRTILPLMKYFCSFVKIQLVVLAWGYLWVPHCVPLLYVSIPLPISHSLNYCSYTVSLLNQGRVIAPNLFLFKIVLAVLVPLSFFFFFAFLYEF